MEQVMRFREIWVQDAFRMDIVLTIIGSDGGLWPGGHQAIIWTNAEILLIGPWEQTSVNLNQSYTFQSSGYTCVITETPTLTAI